MPDLNHSIDAHTSQMREWWRDPGYDPEAAKFKREYRIRESEIEKYLKGRGS